MIKWSLSLLKKHLTNIKTVQTKTSRWLTQCNLQAHKLLDNDWTFRLQLFMLQHIGSLSHKLLLESLCKYKDTHTDRHLEQSAIARFKKNPIHFIHKGWSTLMTFKIRTDFFFFFNWASYTYRLCNSHRGKNWPSYTLNDWGSYTTRL